MPTQKESSILSELKAMKQRMETLYLESFPEGKSLDPDPSEGMPNWQPFVDIYEGVAEWILMADLPGVLDSDLEVEVKENHLTLRGQRQSMPFGSELKAVQTERPAGRFSRTFVLPHKFKEDAVKAELKRGVLTITIPKGRADAETSHRVKVRCE